MIKRIALLTIFTVLLLFVPKVVVAPLYAQVSCPSYMNPNSVQCLDYLREQVNNIQIQLGSLQKQLEKEEYASYLFKKR